MRGGGGGYLVMREGGEGLPGYEGGLLVVMWGLNMVMWAA